MDYDAQGLHENYAIGRALDDATQALWMDVIDGYLPTRARRILDVGCGSGRFAVPMAARFGVPVIGIDPSRGMLAQSKPVGGFARLRGRAEAMPVTDGCADFVFASMVIHHVEHVGRFAGELARVLAPGGRVLIRNCFENRMDDICFFRYCPAALRVENARMPSVEKIEESLTTAGLRRVALRRVFQQTDRNLRAHYERLLTRSMSTFALMTEQETSQGLKSIRRAAEADPTGRPVIEGIDVLVFERS